MKMQKAVVVVPTNRESNIKEFLAAWQSNFDSVEMIVVEDSPTRTFLIDGYDNVTHYAWDDIDRDLGNDSWIISRKTDCIRSYGFLKAYSLQSDMVVTLDDDCFPPEGQRNFLQEHWSCLEKQASSDAWQTTGAGVASRGIPYYTRARQWPCVINHGLWMGVPDFDSPTQLLSARHDFSFSPVNQVIPPGSYFPMCGMNLAFRPQVIPALYFLLMGATWGVDRFGDIWSGIIVKKICDHLGFAIRSGEPSIVHRRASNVWDNLSKEANGLRSNEDFWLAIDRIVLHSDSFPDCYIEIASQLPAPGEYWCSLKQAMITWAKLFTP